VCLLTPKAEVLFRFLSVLPIVKLSKVIARKLTLRILRLTMGSSRNFTEKMTAKCQLDSNRT
jgi:hypothetical protein